MIEFKEGMTIGQIVDGLADDYFAAGADAMTANLLALRDVQMAFADFAKNAVEIVTSVLGDPADQEVPGDVERPDVCPVDPDCGCWDCTDDCSVCWRGPMCDWDDESPCQLVQRPNREVSGDD